MKTNKLLKRIMSIMVVTCILLSALTIPAFSADSATIISQTGGSTIDADKGVLLCYVDFETKAVEMTGFEDDLLSTADITVEDEKWINSNPYGGYIHMAGHPNKPTRTVIRFNGSKGMDLGKGTIVATYKVAAKEPTETNLFSLSDKITYNNGLTYSVKHESELESIFNAAGGWVNITTVITLPENIDNLLSFEIDYHATCYHYIDDIKLWYYPDDAFIVNKAGSLSMTIPSGVSYTLP